ncbi:hypothetical protein L9F63_005550, partial [Diploptera punctata]
IVKVFVLTFKYDLDYTNNISFFVNLIEVFLFFVSRFVKTALNSNIHSFLY